MTSPASAASSAQAAQEGLAVAVGYDIERALNQLDVSSLRRSLPDFKALVAAIVHKYGPASASMAARFYKAQRRDAGVTTAFRPKMADPAGLQQIGQTVDWATQPLWSQTPDLTVARSNVTGAVERLVLDTGRNTVLSNTMSDQKCLGWVRTPEPGCCSFCALLTIRGSVYAHSSFSRSNARFKDHANFPTDFKTHDHCRCQAEPIFTPYVPDAQVLAWQQLYKDAPYGRNATEARNNFRIALEQQRANTAAARRAA